MNKEEILQASRLEHRNRDLAELDTVQCAGNYAGRVGAFVCCLISLLAGLVADIVLYSPWIIYFSIVGTVWIVRAIRQKRKSDWILAIMFCLLALFALIGFILRLSEVPV